jgi:hypothetical protein
MAEVLMAVKIRPDGTIEADTPEEAVAAFRLKENSNAPNGRASRPSPPPSTDTTLQWSAFKSELEPHHVRMLATIKLNGRATVEQLAAAANASKPAIGGYLLAINRAAARTFGEGVGPRLIKREEKGYGPKRVVSYLSGPLLTSHDL